VKSFFNFFKLKTRKRDCWTVAVAAQRNFFVRNKALKSDSNFLATIFFRKEKGKSRKKKKKRVHPVGARNDAAASASSTVRTRRLLRSGQSTTTELLLYKTRFPPPPLLELSLSLSLSRTGPVEGRKSPLQYHQPRNSGAQRFF
jgi:hypothetical protein